jgi:hypothetical protein
MAMMNTPVGPMRDGRDCLGAFLRHLNSPRTVHLPEPARRKDDPTEQQKRADGIGKGAGADHIPGDAGSDRPGHHKDRQPQTSDRERQSPDRARESMSCPRSGLLVAQ